jgi:hypothetical protein
MTFQAYLDTVKAKTGLDPADFKKLAEEKGLLESNAKGEIASAPIVAWLETDFGLGRGHAMAIVGTLKPTRIQDKSDDPVTAYFSGSKATWRETFDSLLKQLEEFGPVGIAPTNSYIGLVKGTGKFAIVAATGDRLDIGIKLKGVEPTGRFAASGTWNAMVTHRVMVTDAAEIDSQLLNWLRDAYEKA